jgi:hypothetical protein
MAPSELTKNFLFGVPVSTKALLDLRKYLRGAGVEWAMLYFRLSVCSTLARSNESPEALSVRLTALIRLSACRIESLKRRCACPWRSPRIMFYYFILLTTVNVTRPSERLSDCRSSVERRKPKKHSERWITRLVCR